MCNVAPMRTVPGTRGLELLGIQLLNNTQKRVAAMIGNALGREDCFSAVQLNHIVKKRRLPSLEVACALDRLFGISPHEWTRPPQKWSPK